MVTGERAEYYCGKQEGQWDGEEKCTLMDGDAIAHDTVQYEWGPEEM